MLIIFEVLGTKNLMRMISREIWPSIQEREKISPWKWQWSWNLPVGCLLGWESADVFKEDEEWGKRVVWYEARPVQAQDLGLVKHLGFYPLGTHYVLHCALYTGHIIDMWCYIIGTMKDTEVRMTWLVLSVNPPTS